MTVVIDDGIAKDAEEPCLGRLAGLKSLCVGECTNVRHLKDVFGGSAIFYSSLNEREESSPLIDQVGDSW